MEGSNPPGRTQAQLLAGEGSQGGIPLHQASPDDHRESGAQRIRRARDPGPPTSRGAGPLTLAAPAADEKPSSLSLPSPGPQNASSRLAPPREPALRTRAPARPPAHWRRWARPLLGGRLRGRLPGVHV